METEEGFPSLTSDSCRPDTKSAVSEAVWRVGGGWRWGWRDSSASVE